MGLHLGGFYQNVGVPVGVYHMQKYRQLNWLQCGILTPLGYTWGPEHPLQGRHTMRFRVKSRKSRLARNILFPKHRIMKILIFIPPKYDTFYGK